MTMWRGSERGQSIFCLLWTLSCLSLIQGNAIIGGSEDVKKEHALSSVTSLQRREWTGRSYLSLSGCAPCYMSDGQTWCAKLSFFKLVSFHPFPSLSFTPNLPFYFVLASLHLFFPLSLSQLSFTLVSICYCVYFPLYYTHFIFLSLLFFFLHSRPFYDVHTVLTLTVT